MSLRKNKSKQVESKDRRNGPNLPTADEPLDLKQLQPAKKKQAAVETTKVKAPVSVPAADATPTSPPDSPTAETTRPWTIRSWAKLIAINAVSATVIGLVYWSFFSQGDAAFDSIDDADQLVSKNDPPLPVAAMSIQPAPEIDRPVADSQVRVNEFPPTAGAPPLAPIKEPTASQEDASDVASKTDEQPVLDDALFSNLEPTEITASATFSVGETAQSYAMSPNGQRLATGHEDGMVRLWDVVSRRRMAEFPGSQAATVCVAISPQATRILAGDAEGSVRLMTVDDTEPAFVLAGHKSAICCAAFFPDGSRAVTADQSGVLHIWDLQARTSSQTIETSERVTQLLLSPDGHSLWVGNWNGEVSAWNLANGQLTQTTPAVNGPVASLSLGADQTTLITAGWEGALHFWNVESDEKHSEFADSIAPRSLRVASRDGKRLIVGGTDGVIELESSLVTHRLRIKETVSEKRPLHLLASLDGESLLSIDRKGTVRIWHVLVIAGGETS